VELLHVSAHVSDDPAESLCLLLEFGTAAAKALSLKFRRRNCGASGHCVCGHGGRAAGRCVVLADLGPQRRDLRTRLGELGLLLRRVSPGAFTFSL
jgi:hypothetical protein